MEAGKEQQNGMAIYEFRGAEKYAAYYVTSNKAAILVITADRGDILSAKDEFMSAPLVPQLLSLLYWESFLSLLQVK
ncbi:MAG: hypothetical protein ACLUN0_07385 [Roseburia sp.]